MAQIWWALQVILREHPPHDVQVDGDWTPVRLSTRFKSLVEDRTLGPLVRILTLRTNDDEPGNFPIGIVRFLDQTVPVVWKGELENYLNAIYKLLNGLKDELANHGAYIYQETGGLYFTVVFTFEKEVGRLSTKLSTVTLKSWQGVNDFPGKGIDLPLPFAEVTWRECIRQRLPSLGQTA